MGGTRGIVWGLDVRPCHCLVIWTGGRVACSDCWARDTRCGKDGRTASAQSVIQLCPRRGKQTIRAVPVQGAWGGGQASWETIAALDEGVGEQSRESTGSARGPVFGLWTSTGSSYEVS